MNCVRRDVDDYVPQKKDHSDFDWRLTKVSEILHRQTDKVSIDYANNLIIYLRQTNVSLAFNESQDNKMKSRGQATEGLLN